MELDYLVVNGAKMIILQVLHGAEHDIEWLERDFGLYIVNLFDTYHASHMLELAQHSLAYLLKFYCDVSANKQYQLADWRIRYVGLVACRGFPLLSSYH